MPTSIAPLPLSAPVESWVPTRLKYLVSSAGQGSCSARELHLVPSSDVGLSPSDPIGERLPSPVTPIVTRPDVSDRESPVVLHETVHVAPSWQIGEDVPRAPAGALLLILGQEAGVVTSGKLAATDLVVASSLFVLVARPEINPRWLRYALLTPMTTDGAPDADLGAGVGTGVGLASLLQRKINVPPRADQDLIADHLDRSIAEMRSAEEELRRHAELLVERREALMRGLIQGDRSLMASASDQDASAACAAAVSSWPAAQVEPAAVPEMPSAPSDGSPSAPVGKAFMSAPRPPFR